MDIYSLINSTAISNYCREINHQFSSLEMAYFINDNASLNIEQKHELFRELITEQPDMEVAERNWTPYIASLHEFLQIYMEVQNKYLDILYRDEVNCIYSYATKYVGDEDYGEDLRIYSDWDSCYKAIQIDVAEQIGFYKEHDDVVRLEGLRITKRWLNKADDEHSKYIVICMDSDYQPTDIWESRSIISDEDNEILRSFEGMWPEIPTPFQKGDILVSRGNNEPFVLEWIPYWEENGKYSHIVNHHRKYGDFSDLQTGVYWQMEDGSTMWDHGPNYLNLEYCERELEGKERFLIAVSNFMKGEITFDILINSYEIIKAEYRAKEERSFMNGKIDEILIKAGLKEGVSYD